MSGFSRRQQISLHAQSVYKLNQMVRSPGNFHLDYVRDNGSPDLNVDGSASPVTFRFIASEDLLILRMVGHLAASNFGGFADLAELTNGVLIQVNDVPEELGELDLLGGEPITLTAEFGFLSPTTFAIYGGQNSDILVFKLALSDAGVLMYLPESGEVRVVIRDNLSGLLDFRVGVHAVSIDTSESEIDRVTLRQDVR